MAPSEEAPWVAIARRKRSQRDALLPAQWRIPASSPDIAADPDGYDEGIIHTVSSVGRDRRPVVDVPRKYLSKAEISITESHDVPSLLAAVASRKLTASEVTKAFCHRATIAQQLTNCLTEPLFARAFARAQFLDAYLKRTGAVFGPLHGLPVSVKDTFNVQGVDTSIGLASLCFQPAQTDAPLVSLLESLGCVVIAKTNVPQTLASLDSVNNVFGRTMNCANRLLTAGGSSGGEGALVAMKGVMVGWATDIGGSIRVPAWVNGVYGFKPASGRLPYGGQRKTGPEGILRVSVGAVTGPLGRSVTDLEVVLRELVPRAKFWSGDCYGPEWTGERRRGAGEKGQFVLGVLRSDGNCELLPPVNNMMNEVVAKLQACQNVQIVELPTPRAWTRSQSVMSKLMSVDGNQHMAAMINATGEPLVPWMKTRFRIGESRDLRSIIDFQHQRTQLEDQMATLWMHQDEDGRRKRRLDAIICPLAPHPVPEIDRYNAAGYTTSWVMFDNPSATVPVRDVKESDLELGKSLNRKPISSWDERCQELWDESKTDRKVYLGSKLSIQVVAPKSDDEVLIDAMKIVDDAIKSTAAEGRAAKPRL